MCGIAGIIDPESSSLEADILKMRDILHYRGPDSSGYIVEEEDFLALGHRRLSILDPTSAGSQPMADALNILIIVHNGEVYNYVELGRELEKYGYRFRSQTDTEVILAAYDRWGTDCLLRFNGMYSFAIWDKKRKRLFLARDRIGIKPLYYYWDGRRFLFASEVKSILAVLKNTHEINPALIDFYMSFGYIPGEDTLIKGIKRLLPGHYAIFERDTLSKHKYWELSFDNNGNQPFQYYVEHVKELLNSSIDLRLRSDVPLGIFLSGGIDSSAVVALLAPRVEKRLKTFSVAYDFGNKYNETGFARIIAKQFNTDHHEFIVTPAQFRDFIPRYVYHMDEPVTESAAISLYYIAKMASDYVTVVLSGEGSDELFAGYDFYYYNIIIEKWRRVLANKNLSDLSELLCGLLPDNRIRKYLRMSLIPLEKRYKGISTYEEEVKKRLYTSDFKRFVADKYEEGPHDFLNGLFLHTKNNDVLSRMLYFDMKTWLVDDLLIKADRMSMAASLELRVPFLDHRLVEFAAQIPSHCKISGKSTKVIVKEMLKGILPDTIIYRKKMGFPTPLKHMFQEELQDYAHDLLIASSANISTYFRPAEIKRLLDEHASGRKDNHRIIWQLIVLEIWLGTYGSSLPALSLVQ